MIEQGKTENDAVIPSVHLNLAPIINHTPNISSTLCPFWLTLLGMPSDWSWHLSEDWLAAGCVIVSIHYMTAHIHVRISWVWLQQHLGQCSVVFKRICWRGTAAHFLHSSSRRESWLSTFSWHFRLDWNLLKLLLMNTWVVSAGVKITPAENDSCGASMLVAHSLQLITFADENADKDSCPCCCIKNLHMVFFSFFFF